MTQLREWINLTAAIMLSEASEGPAVQAPLAVMTHVGKDWQLPTGECAPYMAAVRLLATLG